MRQTFFRWFTRWVARTIEQWDEHRALKRLRRQYRDDPTKCQKSPRDLRHAYVLLGMDLAESGKAIKALKCVHCGHTKYEI